MFDLYAWTTGNCFKVSIMLEECAFKYKTHWIDITKGEQFAPDFLAITPNNKVPAIVDHENQQKLFESGAILIYLAEKSGKLLAKDPQQRIVTLQWLMFQMSAVGPIFGQLNHFLNVAPANEEYSIKRFSDECARIISVLDVQLKSHEYIAGDYSIADIATAPWLLAARDRLPIDLVQYPNIARWLGAVEERPAVQKGIGIRP